MRGWSFRALVLVVAFAFSVVVVGGIALATYVIYFDGLSSVTHDRAVRAADVAVSHMRENIAEARADAKLRGLDGTAAAAAAQKQVLGNLADLRPQTTGGQSELSLFNGGTDLVWTSDSSVRFGGVKPRIEALQLNRPTLSQGAPPQLFAGLLRPVRLPIVVSHVPLTMPDGSRAVLDVAYIPKAEESVIDSLRAPMTVLTVVASILMIAVIEAVLLLVLGLVRRLSDAADAIDSGRLDARLPDMGANEVGDLARSVNRLIDRLQRRAAAQTQFVANASHELATPVAGIRGYVDILERWGAEDPQVREEAVEAIDRESARMSRLTSDLLNILQSDGTVVFKNERFDVNALARERLASTANAWLHKGIEFEGPEQGEQIVWGDRERLEDVLSILLENAAKYTSEQGCVSVRTDRKHDYVFIEVADTGAGIPEDELPQIFDRFFRSSASRAAGESGFGLGLAIAKDIVDRAGGEIDVESIAGEGTTFTVRWPRGRRPTP